MYELQDIARRSAAYASAADEVEIVCIHGPGSHPSAPPDGICRFRGAEYQVTYKGPTCHVELVTGGSGHARVPPEHFLWRLCKWLFERRQTQEADWRRHIDRQRLAELLSEASVEDLARRCSDWPDRDRQCGGGTRYPEKRQALERILAKSYLLSESERKGLKAVLVLANFDQDMDRFDRQLLAMFLKPRMPWLEELQDLRAQLAGKMHELQCDTACDADDVARMMKRLYALDVELVLAMQAAIEADAPGGGNARAEADTPMADPCALLVDGFLAGGHVSLAEKASLLLARLGDTRPPFFGHLIDLVACELRAADHSEDEIRAILLATRCPADEAGGKGLLDEMVAGKLAGKRKVPEPLAAAAFSPAC